MVQVTGQIILSLFFIFFTFPGIAQDIHITGTELKGDDVLIHYELLDENLDQRYSIHLYSSRDNYIQPLEKVEGDVGVDITVGGNKKAIWHAKEELGEDFNGNIALELKGSIYIPFIALEGLQEGKVFKRGKPYDFIWSGGRGDNVLDFELYDGDNLVGVFDERPNVGNTTLVFPLDVKPGVYRLRISDKRNKDEVVYTITFRVKRKVPLGLKVGAFVAVGAAVGILVSVSSGGGPGEGPDIPEPPLPTR